MYAKIEPTGCCERNGLVQIRIDMFLDKGDFKYDERIDSPFHSHFIYVEPETPDSEIQKQMEFHLPNFYAAWCAGKTMRSGWDVATRIRPKRYRKIQSRINKCNSKIEALTRSELSIQSNDIGKTFPATEIDIGSEAINRANYQGGAYTRITTANPANDSGTLDTIEVYVYNNVSLFKAGTFYGSSTSYTNRDYHDIGSITTGAKRTFTGLDIDVESGDYLGWYWPDSDQYIECTEDSTTYYYKLGDQFSAGTQTYGSYSGRTYSVYGTGETAISAISNTIQLVFNVRKAISDQTQLVWNVREAISDTAQLVWHTRKAIGDTTQLIWNVLAIGAISDTVQLVWHVRKAVSDQTQLVWNTKKIISDSIQTIWNVKTKISDTIQLVWNVRQAISDTIQIVYDVREKISDTVQLKYNALKTISDMIRLLWDVGLVVQHPIIASRYPTALTEVNRFLFMGKDADGNPVYSLAEDDDDIDDVGEYIDEIRDISIDNQDDADTVAAAIKRRQEIFEDLGYIQIQPNCCQEQYDVIRIIDSLCGVNRLYRVLDIYLEYDCLNYSPGKLEQILKIGNV